MYFWVTVDFCPFSPRQSEDAGEGIPDATENADEYVCRHSRTEDGLAVCSKFLPPSVD